MGVSKVEGEKEKRKLKAFMKSLYIQKDKKDKGQSPVVEATEGAGVIDGSKYNKKS